MTAFCINRTEAKNIYRDMATYFSHGIEVHADDVVFDVGANIGLFTLAVLQRCGENVTVYAFEPVPPIFEVLRLNTERFGPARLKSFCLGLSREPKTLTFNYFPRATAWSSACPQRASLRAEQRRIRDSVLLAIKEGRHPWLRLLPPFLRPLVLDIGIRKIFEPKRIDCEVKTLSQIIDEQQIGRIDLLKVDVESSELDVLAGIEERDWQKIRQLVVEVEHFSSQAKIIVALLRDHGFGRIEHEQDAVQKAADYGMIYAKRTAPVADEPAEH